MNDAEPLRAVHPEFLSAQRDVSVAAKGDKLLALQDAALRLAHFVANGKFLKPDAVDALCEAAANNGLHAKFRRDDIEHVIGQGLAGIATLLPRLEPASHDPTRLAGAHARALYVRRASEINPQPIEWMWPNRIAIGKLTLIVGEPGLGKSQLTAFLTAIETTGGRWPCNEGIASLGSVVIFSAEDDAADTIVPRLMAVGADLERIRIVEAVPTEKGGRRMFNLQSDLARLEHELDVTLDARLVVFDPLTAYFGSVDTHRNSDVRGVLGLLAEMAARRRVAVVAVSHWNKSGAGSALNRVTGSGAFVAAVRAGYMVAKDPEDDDRRLFVSMKNNLAKVGSGLAFRIEQRMVGPNANILASGIVWDDERVTQTADEILAAGNGTEPTQTAKKDCIEFLRSILATGPMTVADIEAEAVAAGLHQEGRPLKDNKPMRAARDALGIEPKREGFGRGARYSWAFRAAPWVPSNAIGALPENRAPMGSEGTHGGSDTNGKSERTERRRENGRG